MKLEILTYLKGLKQDIEETYIDDVSDAIEKQAELKLIDEIISYIDDLRE